MFLFEKEKYQKPQSAGVQRTVASFPRRFGIFFSSLAQNLSLKINPKRHKARFVGCCCGGSFCTSSEQSISAIAEVVNGCRIGSSPRSRTGTAVGGLARARAGGRRTAPLRRPLPRLCERRPQRWCRRSGGAEKHACTTPANASLEIDW